MLCYSASGSGENVGAGAEQQASEREGKGSAILETGKESSLSEGKRSSSSIVMDSARKSAILERGRGSTVLEGSSVVIEGGARDTPAVTEREGEEVTTTDDLKAASGEEVGGGEDSTHQRESHKEEALRGEGGKAKQRKKKYVLKGGASALAVQLFGMDDKFEMRSVVIHALCLLNKSLIFTFRNINYCRSIDLLPMVFQLFPVSFMMTSL